MPFWVGGSGNITDAAGHWAAVSGGAPGAGNLPVAGTDAIWDANSGVGSYTITRNGNFNCRHFDMGAAAGTPTLAGAVGDLVMTGNLTLKAGMTWASAGALFFAATSGTQVITTNGVVIATASWRFSGAAPGTVQLGDDIIFRSSATLGHSAAAGTMLFDANGKTATFEPLGSTITLNTNAAGNLAFYNLHLIANATKTSQIVVNINGPLIVTNSLKYLGDSAINRLFIRAFGVGGAIGSPATIQAAAIDGTSNFVDFQDIAATGAAAPFNVGSSIGDALGNSGITFTPAVTQTATGTASFSWSTHGWTTRVPLPQDDVLVPNAFIAGRTITMDMPRMGKNITFTCTGNPTLSITASDPAFYGNFTLAAGMVVGGVSNPVPSGRGAHTFTSNGATINRPFVFSGPGGTYTLQDPYVSSTSFTVVVNATFNANGFAVTATNFSVNGSVNLGTGTWTITGSGAVWNATAGSVITPSTSTIKFTDGTATAKTFAGGGKTYNNVWFNNAGTGTFDITGSNTFNVFKVDAGRTVRFTAGTTNTAADWQFGAGCIISSITAATHTLAKSGGGQVIAENAIISRSTASPANTFLAPGGTDNGNNVNWNFTAVLHARTPAFGLDFTASAAGASIRNSEAAFSLDFVDAFEGEAAFDFRDAAPAFSLDFDFVPGYFPKPKKNVLRVAANPDRLMVPEWTQ
jgi:hypothetical protein